MLIRAVESCMRVFVGHRLGKLVMSNLELWEDLPEDIAGSLEITCKRPVGNEWRLEALPKSSHNPELLIGTPLVPMQSVR